MRRVYFWTLVALDSEKKVDLIFSEQIGCKRKTPRLSLKREWIINGDKLLTNGKDKMLLKAYKLEMDKQESLTKVKVKLCESETKKTAVVIFSLPLLLWHWRALPGKYKYNLSNYMFRVLRETTGGGSIGLFKQLNFKNLSAGKH